MKKIIFFSLILFLTFALFPISTHAHAQAQPITVSLDDLSVEFDVKPTIINNRTMVPFRALAEALSVKVTWNSQNQTIIATDENNSILLKINDPLAIKNSKQIQLDMPPILMNNRTLIPLRFFSEAFGCKVDWDSLNNKISIISPPRALSITGFYALGDKQTSSWTNLFTKKYPDTVQGNTDVISTLALGWYSLDKDGLLLTKSDTYWQRPEGWDQVLNAAKQYHLNTEMVIHLTDNKQTISTLISNNVAITTAVKNIVTEAQMYNGVNLDFEGLGWNDTPEQLQTVQYNFSKFISQLTNELHKKNIPLTLTLHAPNSAYKGYDYKTLGQLADEIIIMAYDYGPIPEPTNLIIKAVEMAKSQVPSNKLVLGVSLPNENSESILAKIGIAKRYNLKGIALWRLGLVTDDTWDTLRNNIIAKN